MSDTSSRLIKFLDQLLPFLETAPAWLKSWIYVLIVLNFLTAAGLAIFYLLSKQTAAEKGSLHYFSVQRPANGDDIPLGNSQNWMISGTFPQGTDATLAKSADVNVEVYKLPDRTSVPQRTSQKRISTAEGVWRFESAAFDGYGSYEIVATGSLGGNSVYRTVNVTCSDKGSAYRQSIEREKRFRTIAEVEPEPGGVALLPQLKEQFISLQNQLFAVYHLNPNRTPADLEKALAMVNGGLDQMDSALLQAPNDWDLQNFRAFFLKDYAQITEDLNKPQESALALNEALLMFEAILQQQPSDPNPWNGLGSVYLILRQPAKALFYINRALELAPNYTEALQDKETAERMLQEQMASRTANQ